MKILLTAVNAKYIHSNPAVYCLRAAAREYENQIEICEFTINNHVDDILKGIYKRKPDVLCLSCYIWNLPHMEEIMTEYHKLCPKVPIWVGGPEVSYEVQAFLEEHPQVTGVMIGEGEATFRELCRYYAGEEDCSLEHIKGIAYRDGDFGHIRINEGRESLDMSHLPFCYDKAEDFSNRIIYYESSRGCPFSCSYCLSSVDKKLRFRDLSLVKEELGFFIEQKVPQVKFVDRTFNCNHEHAMEIWRFIKEQDNGVTNFHFEISADLLNDAELKLISQMRPGLIQLEIGVQSTNEVTIQEIKRTMKLERLKSVVKQIQSFGNIHQHLDLIAGLPMEGYDSFANSFNEIYALRPDQLQLGFLKVLKGSYMYEHAKEYGILYHNKPPYEVLSTNWLSFEEVLRLKKVEEMVEVYYNSHQFDMGIGVLVSQFTDAFQMYQRLGDFYEKKGYDTMSHSRIRRCEILLEFADCEIGGRIQDCLKEALVYDLYCRENCKSRPSWAVDMAGFKHMTHFYCKNGKMSHVEPFHYDFYEYNPKKGLPKQTGEVQWLLFSYEKRNPLTYCAFVEKAKYKEPEVKPEKK